MHRLRRDDDGAVAVLVAIVMVAMLAMTTIVLDVGSLYAERRQLQNGADAAVLALALDCPTSTGCDPSTAPTGPAGTKARQNANDGTATVASPSGPAICGNGPNLQPCSPASGLGPWDCRALPSSGPLASARFVQVRTETAANGANLVPPILAQVAVPGYPGTIVRACARASWGGSAAMTTGLALTISHCEWDVATSGGTAFAPPPPATPATSFERVLKLHGTEKTAPPPCPAAGHSGSDGPGAFGWLSDGTTKDCAAEIDLSTTAGQDDTVDPKKGVGVPAACKDPLLESLLTPYPVIYIPVYDSYDASAKTYTFEGFAAFVITGWNLPGMKQGYKSQASWLSGSSYCKGDDFCLYGYFTKPLIPTSGIIGGPSMGVTVVQMSG